MDQIEYPSELEEQSLPKPQLVERKPNQRRAWLALLIPILLITGLSLYWILIAGPRHNKSTIIEYDGFNPFIAMSTAICAMSKGNIPCCIGSAMLYSFMSTNINVTVFDGQKMFN
ncbi:hypothetical protein C6P44_001035 [Monosporozyma unispora]|nr:hypothetical protein C6P44_001035 [Kazachstania unispora]